MQTYLKLGWLPDSRCWTHSGVKSYPQTKEVGVVDKVVVGQSGSFWAPCGPLWERANSCHSYLHFYVSSHCLFARWLLPRWTECWWGRRRKASPAALTAPSGVDCPLLAWRRPRGASPAACCPSRSPSAGLATWVTQRESSTRGMSDCGSRGEVGFPLIAIVVVIHIPLYHSLLFSWARP